MVAHYFIIGAGRCQRRAATGAILVAVDIVAILSIDLVVVIAARYGANKSVPIRRTV